MGKGCPEKPRCRWRSGLPDLELVPRRLLVSLIATWRVNGRVQQEHVADLGSIDAHMLPSFFAGVEPERANAIRLDLKAMVVRVDLGAAQFLGGHRGAAGPALESAYR
jgi:hypothetical protein